ncbi:MAG: preprotein translocase subunit YajC [Elusimicrobia bacterium RIFOXYA12_FULL_51_18]|nr:MAG: preprotein translocase subunit YajC [Elusimicrobia bacterium RIFOXYA12_FULL_51_18]OGS30101.1 MAG: preprotein translocase subunit YajC [Elusimicrobia bacterium RIFOXYA2_FULL_53_38]
MQFIPLIIIMVIFYFLLIRPQQKQAKERKAMLDALKSGDKILTNGGILGLITGINGDELDVEIAKNVKVSVVRSAVAGLVNQTGK